MGGVINELGFPDSGTAQTPTHVYRDWIVEDMDPMMTAMQAADSTTPRNPYSNKVAIDPDTELASSQAAITATGVLASALPTTIGLSAYSAAVKAADVFNTTILTDAVAIETAERSATALAVTGALSAASSAVTSSITSLPAIDSASITAMVTAYSTRIKKQYLQAMARLASSLSDINAVNSSAFVWGMAGLERQLLDDVNHYDASLDMELNKLKYAKQLEIYTAAFNEYMQTFRVTFAEHLHGYLSRDIILLNQITNLVATTQNMIQNKYTSQFNLMNAQLAFNLSKYQVLTSEQDKQLDIDLEEQLWRWKMYQYGANFFSCAGGAALISSQKTTTKTEDLQMKLASYMNISSLLTQLGSMNYSSGGSMYGSGSNDTAWGG
jgi:hypothetical protein